MLRNLRKRAQRNWSAAAQRQRWVGSAGLTNRVMHAASNRRRILLQKGFERFLPPAVIAQILASETLPKLGGERREISVLFCDIAGSTTLAESIEPESLAAIYISRAYARRSLNREAQ